MALFDEEDSSLLKKWIVKRLEDMWVSFTTSTKCLNIPSNISSRSDADADVLADYVLALLRHQQSEDEVKQMCEDQLLDFLHDRQSDTLSKC